MPAGVLQLNHACSQVTDHGREVEVSFVDGESVRADLVIGADGIDSIVRKILWGDSPKRAHRLHLLGGYLFLPEDRVSDRGVFSHDRMTAAAG